MADQQFLPPQSGGTVPHVGTYRRMLPVSVERLYENALDWEHLPHLHRESFAGARCLDSGSWGWRAVVTRHDGRESVIELDLDRRCRRWITRTLEGAGAGSEVWTQALPLGPAQVDIVVDFFVPDLPPERRRRAGETFARLYTRLYDEDVAMMRERQRQLDRRVGAVREGERRTVLGPRGALRLPMRVVAGGRDFVLTEADGELLAFPAQCPHQLGPLDAGEFDGAVVRCPWHGYRFDVRSGENLSGGTCRLTRLPRVEVSADGTVVLVAGH